MKTYLMLLLLGGIGISNAQVIIGDKVGTAANKTSVLLEFAKDQNKGLIVPYVRTLPTDPTPGTILLDASTPTAARMKYWNGTSWIDLSGQDANLVTPTDFLAVQPTAAEVPELDASKVIIGGTTSSADGALVLESNTKAMVLPTVEDVKNIPSPSPGMMVYVKKDGAKRLAVFNGSKWSFWKS